MTIIDDVKNKLKGLEAEVEQLTQPMPAPTTAVAPIAQVQAQSDQPSLAETLLSVSATGRAVEAAVVHGTPKQNEEKTA